jgi:ubiquinone/menaquinone biosynthesis C-methylase UbiE
MKKNATEAERNAIFYGKYNLFDYFRDYINCSNGVYQYLVNNFEITEISEILKTGAYTKILLVGLGFGRELDAILKMSPDIQVDVIDFNAGFIDPAERIYSNSKVKFHQVDLNNESLSNFQTETFDFIISLNTLEYISENGFHLFFKEANRVLSKSGSIFVRLYNSSFPFFFFDRRHLNKRANDKPMLYPRPYIPSKRIIEKYFHISKIIPQGFQINIRLLRPFYSDSLAFLTWKIETWIARICAPRHTKNVYFVGLKP